MKNEKLSNLSKEFDTFHSFLMDQIYFFGALTMFKRTIGSVRARVKLK